MKDSDFQAEVCKYADPVTGQDNYKIAFHGTDELVDAMTKEQAAINAEIEALKKGPCAPCF